MTFIYLLFIMILVFWELLGWGFGSAGLFFLLGVIVTVILISIFTFRGSLRYPLLTSLLYTLLGIMSSIIFRKFKIFIKK